MPSQHVRDNLIGFLLIFGFILIVIALVDILINGIISDTELPDIIFRTFLL